MYGECIFFRLGIIACLLYPIFLAVFLIKKKLTGFIIFYELDMIQFSFRFCVLGPKSVRMFAMPNNETKT